MARGGFAVCSRSEAKGVEAEGLGSGGEFGEGGADLGVAEKEVGFAEALAPELGNGRRGRGPGRSRAAGVGRGRRSRYSRPRLV